MDDAVFKGNDAPKFLVHLDEDKLPETLLIGEDDVVEDIGFDSANYDTLWESHGWDHVYEFIDSIPKLEANTDYCFRFHRNTQTDRKDLSFPLFMIAAMLRKGYCPEANMSCSVDKSEDGANHFALMRRK